MEEIHKSIRSLAPFIPPLLQFFFLSFSSFSSVIISQLADTATNTGLAAASTGFPSLLRRPPP